MYMWCFKDLRTKNLYAEGGGNNTIATQDRVFVPPELKAGPEPSDHKQKCIELDS